MTWVDAETRADMVRRYAAGESMKAIAAALGRHNHTVRRHLVDAGVELRYDARRGEPFGERTISPAVAGQIARRYQAGESIRTIAGCVGYSFGAVRNAIAQSGVALRPQRGA